MTIASAGYAWLVHHRQLPARPLRRTAVIDSAIKGRGVDMQGDVELLRFERKYQPHDTIASHLQFALRYEGVNLEVLALLFANINPAEIETWLADKPESVFARRAGYLYEWLTRRDIAASVPPKSAYVAVLDEKLHFTRRPGSRNPKFRVIDNLPGTVDFCPLVRKTAYLSEMAKKELKRRTEETLANYDPDLLRRAAAFLYLKETHSSFEVEREKPSADRAQRFADLLRQAEANIPLSEERFVQLQNAVVDPRFHEGSYRTQQNWIGRDLGYRKQVDYVPPRPEDVPALMGGLVKLAETFRSHPDCVEPVVLAAMVSFGFVFIHPFMDGNGRLHRYLIHESLSSAGFTPKGIILPVSAVILANLERYVDALERFSKPLAARTSYNADVPASPARGNDPVYYRYFDATDQTTFLYWAIERTVEQDLAKEIDYLLGFDKARAALDSNADWPAHALDLFIRLVHQNGGKLSKTKRESHFQWMTDEELATFEEIVRNAFGLAPLSKSNVNHP